MLKICLNSPPFIIPDPFLSILNFDKYIIKKTNLKAREYRRKSIARQTAENVLDDVFQ